MSFRGGRGGRGRGRGGFSFRRGARAEALELYPEIEGLGTIKEMPIEELRKYIQFANWSQNLQSFCQASIYYVEDESQRLQKLENVDIERYSDRKTRPIKIKQSLSDIVKLDKDHMPAELARGVKMRKGPPKRVRWDNGELDLTKLDRFEKIEEKLEGKEVADEEEEEEEEAAEEDDGEYSDDGDYEQGEEFDDDEDDYNMVEEAEEAEY